jgi:hypothetical protein
MSGNRFLRAAVLAILLSLASCSGGIVACDDEPPTIRLACSNLEASLFVDQLDIDQAQATIQNLHDLVPACQEDLTPVLPRLEQEITQWISSSPRRFLFSDGDLTFEPYSLQREREIRLTNSVLSYCYYDETRRAGNWLIVHNASRPYCVPLRLRLDQCAEPILSPPRFLFYLLSHPGLTTLSWAMGLLLAAGALLSLFQRLTRDRPRRVPWIFIVLGLAAVLLFLGPFWTLGQVPVWIASLYILFLLYRRFREGQAR